MSKGKITGPDPIAFSGIIDKGIYPNSIVIGMSIERDILEFIELIQNKNATIIVKDHKGGKLEIDMDLFTGGLGLRLDDWK